MSLHVPSLSPFSSMLHLFHIFSSYFPQLHQVGSEDTWRSSVIWTKPGQRELRGNVHVGKRPLELGPKDGRNHRNGFFGLWMIRDLKNSSGLLLEIEIYRFHLEIFGIEMMHGLPAAPGTGLQGPIWAPFGSHFREQKHLFHSTV